MSAHKGTIVRISAGHMLPNAYAEKLLKANPSAVGYAFRDGDDKFVSVESGGGLFDVKQIEEINDAFKDNEMFMMFMNYPEKFKEEDLQPFTLLKNDKGSPVLVGFATGKFNNFIPSGSDHSNEYFMFNRWLIPKLNRIYEDKGKDIAKMMAELNDPIVKQDFDNICTAGGSLILLAGNGQMHTTLNEENRRKFVWGETTDHLGYSESTGLDGPDQVATPIEKKTPSFLAKKKAKEAEAAPPIIAPEPLPAPAKTASAAYPQDTGTEYIPVKVPEAIWNSNKAIKKFLQNALGHLPKNWSDFKTAEWRKKKELPYKAPVEKPAVIKDLKDLKNVTEVKHIASTEPIKQPEQKQSFLAPIMPAKIKEAVASDFGKVLDKNSLTIPLNPTKIQEEEDKFESFWEGSGISRDVTDRWDDQTICDLCLKYPMAAFILLKNYRADAIINRPQEIAEDELDTSTSGNTIVTEKKKFIHPSKRVAM